MNASRKSGVADTIPFNNTIERAMRPIALGRRESSVRRLGRGRTILGLHASLIETCKMNDVDPQAWLADVLDKIANRHPMSKIDELLPWAYINNGAKRQAA